MAALGAILSTQDIETNAMSSPTPGATVSIDATLVGVVMGVTILHEGPATRVIKDGVQIASDELGDLGTFAGWLLEIRKAGIHSGTVAHIGGGLCCLARMMGPAYGHIIYEREWLLAKYRPDGAAFIAGDWRDAIFGTYDAIIYDLEGVVPREDLSKFLRPGGIILPSEAR